MLKKISAYGLLAILVVLLISNIIFSLILNSHKKTIPHTRAQYAHLLISKTDSENKQNIEVENEHEIKYNGNWFDITSIDVHEEYICLTGHFDHEENKLTQLVAASSNVNSNASNSFLITSLVNYIFCFYEQPFKFIFKRMTFVRNTFPNLYCTISKFKYKRPIVIPP